MARRLHLIVPIILLFAGLALRNADPEVLVGFRVQIFDFYQSLKPRVYKPSGVRIIDLDDESLEKLGQWPWPRLLLAEMVERLTDAGAAVIVFDMVFAEPDRSSPRRAVETWPVTRQTADIRERVASLPDYDEAFAAAIAEANVVTGFVLVEDGGGRAPALKTSYAYAGDEATQFVPSFGGSVTNLPIIEQAAAGNGSFNSVVETDGVIRHVPLLVEYDGALYPTLAAEALRVVQGAPTILIKTSGANRERAFGELTGITDIKIGQLPASTDREGRILLYDTGSVADRYVSAWRVFEEDFDESKVRDHIVLIGTSAAGLKDIRATPLEHAVAGVELHAQAVEQILQKEFLERPDYAKGLEIVFLLVFGAILVVVLPRIGAAWGGLFAGAGIAAALGFSWYAFVELGLLFAPIYPSIIALAVYLSSSIISYLRTEAERQQVRSAFSRFMSPALVEQLAEDPSRLKLGGEMRDMTLLFCDIRGFTTISEQFDAVGLTRLINRFLTPMTNIILDRRGTIDKYMGDCIMAFWNAPLDDADHARNGCRSALEMMSRLGPLNEELREEAAEEGRQDVPIKVGIGLNTGECCVGNMGSELRFDYSVLGDDVNLASRLEGQSKSYGVDIVIGENTQLRADDFATLELDLIQVKGKTLPVRIFALMGDEALADDTTFQALLAKHGDMLAAYRAQDWTGMRELVAECRTRAPGLGLGPLYDLYDARCDVFEADPPGDDWDGVFIATTK
jgi:adenylate cyclase